jgi:protein ImuB
LDPTRLLVVWCPDWPVVAARQITPALAGAPVAILEAGPRGLAVRAASSEARAAGVTVGMRRHEAETSCPGLVLAVADPAGEARAFEAVARAAETITPRVVLEEPGRLAFATHGPSRYFGGDASLAARTLDVLRPLGGHDIRVGIADGAFASGLAARAARAGAARIVASGGSPEFLARWPVGVLAPVVEDGEHLSSLLVRLGVTTLGAFAVFPTSSVLARFGPAGGYAHRLARGLDPHPVTPRSRPPELLESVEFDPPVTRVEEAVFPVKALADRLLARLDALGLSCPQVLVEAETEHGERLTRSWRHDGVLTVAALVARVRWQLDAWAGATRDRHELGGLTLVRLVPDRVVPARGRQLGFWGGDAAAQDRADRALARLQGLLGHEAVVTAVPVGGRTPAEQVRWLPWSEPRDVGPTGGEVPAWPGAVPGPAPARVHTPPLPAELLDVDGRPVVVSGRGEPSGTPAVLRCAALTPDPAVVTAWAGPWPCDVRWWDRVERRRRVLWQVVVGEGDAGVACLVTVEGDRAGIEAIYD